MYSRGGDLLTAAAVPVGQPRHVVRRPAGFHAREKLVQGRLALADDRVIRLRAFLQGAFRESRGVDPARTI